VNVNYVLCVPCFALTLACLPNIHTCTVFGLGLLICFTYVKAQLGYRFMFRIEGQVSLGFQLWELPSEMQRLFQLIVYADEKVGGVSCLHCCGLRTYGWDCLWWHSLRRNSSELFPTLCTASGFVNESAVAGRGSAFMGQKERIRRRLDMQ